MRIETDSVLRYPRSAVYSAYRDEVQLICEFLPNVRSIDDAERSVEGPVARIRNVWHGSTELPLSLADALERRFLSWDVEAVWDERDWACDWSIHPHALTEHVRCAGRTRFVELDEDRTRLEVSGELTFELETMRAVPGFLAGSLGRTAERFLVRTITANLANVGDALAQYLKDDTVS